MERKKHTANSTPARPAARRRLSALDVQFISLVACGANRRTFLVKQARAEGLDPVEKQIAIVKTDALRRLVYGVVYAPDDVDTEGDTMSAAEIEKASYGFMQALLPAVTS